ncbi:MAG: DUF4339 domain-containing protein [Arenimonas sp.]
MATATKTTWHISSNGRVAGPYTTQQLADLGKGGKITTGMYASKNGGEWAPVEKVRGLHVTGLMPSRRQADYARDLGIKVRPGVTRDELSAQMDAATGRSYKTGRFVKQTGHVTIEKTGKGLKAAMVLNWVAFLLGIAMIAANLPVEGRDIGPAFQAGSLMMTGSFVVGFGLRVARWWNHG